METFYSIIKTLNPEDKEVFTDDDDTEWVIRADGTGIQASANGTVKFTENHLLHVRPPSGFRRRSNNVHEELDRLASVMQRATKHMAHLQSLIPKENPAN